MSGVFPDEVTGGVIIRDDLGNPTNPPDVQNAYTPAPGFVTSCEMTASPSNCNGRITPAQINAIVSELVALAECLDPDGPWNCTAVTNLCAAFTAWSATHGGLHVGEDPPDPVLNPFWYESDTGILYVFFDDTWVQANGAVADQVSIIGTGVAGRPLQVGVIDSGVY
ncbi:hypothetical protein CQ14_06885 [Bradyrhizobium lablabi]|uniref:Uncharacterized protein n=1 Tax=Bradyrhizobium lablabi TaxID=722472 RepID=A0A0R3MMG9_9BRAD|nr:hypothetical protein [Bradyrhizobium lablabi]KRR21369.1 hypothetical protein CQ14_06885 [Bradyrhizobium lablabi]